MKPSRNSACAVVSNGIRDSSHRHRNLAGGNSSCTGTALMSLEVIEWGTLTYRHVARPYFGLVVKHQFTTSCPCQIFTVHHMHAKYTHRGSHNRWPNHPSQQPKYSRSSEHAIS